MNRKLLLIVSAIGVLVAATPAFAGLGFHVGGSIDPDDFLFGVRFESHPIEEYFTIVPNAEVGFGDVTMLAGNLDGHFNFNTSSEYKPYVGAGFTVNWFDFDGGSDTEVGGSILGGVHFNEKWFGEIKIGLGDVPDWKFIVGFEKP
jgi:hypothetical protein